MTTKSGNVIKANIIDAGKLREEMLNNIQWVGKATRSNRSSDADVSLRMTKGTNKTNKAFQFTFRNQTGTKFGKRAICGFLNDKVVIFTTSKAGEGYAFSCQQRSNGGVHGYFKVPYNDETKGLEKFIGDYMLQYSPIIDMYYIVKDDVEVKL